MTKQNLKDSKVHFSPVLHSPGKLLHDANMALSKDFIRDLKKEGYSFTIDSWALLTLLWEKDNLPQYKLGERIGRDRHQISRLVDSLSEQGFVIRKLDSEKKHIKRVTLTKKGVLAKAKLEAFVIKYLKKVFNEATQEEYKAFIRCLQLIIKNLSSDISDDN